MNFNTGTEPQSIISYDFNNDGKLDVASNNYFTNDLSIYLNCPITSNSIIFDKDQNSRVYPNQTDSYVVLERHDFFSYKIQNKIGMQILNGDGHKQIKLNVRNLLPAIYLYTFRTIRKILFIS